MPGSILLEYLSRSLMGLSEFLHRLQSPSSNPPSPTPTSTPSTPSEDPMVTVMRMMLESQKDQTREILETWKIAMVGRPSNGTSPEPPQFSMPQPTEFDYDSGPLSPGIEAVISRETEEDQLDRLLKERAVYQARMRDLIEEQNERLDQSHLEADSPGPWSEQRERFESPT